MLAVRALEMDRGWPENVRLKFLPEKCVWGRRRPELFAQNVGLFWRKMDRGRGS